MTSDRQRHAKLTTATATAIAAGTADGSAMLTPPPVASPLQQLFVCRSPRLKKLVRVMQAASGGEAELAQADFKLFDDLLLRLEGVVGDMETEIEMLPADPFRPNGNVQYPYFRDAIFPLIRGQSSLAPLVVWTQILSFLKGSIDTPSPPTAACTWRSTWTSAVSRPSAVACLHPTARRPTPSSKNIRST